MTVTAGGNTGKKIFSELIFQGESPRHVFSLSKSCYLHVKNGEKKNFVAYPNCTTAS
jgi:hypothetical protein